MNMLHRMVENWFTKDMLLVMYMKIGSLKDMPWLIVTLCSMLNITYENIISNLGLALINMKYGKN
jgi:hypothetical protein